MYGTNLQRPMNMNRSNSFGSHSSICPEAQVLTNILLRPYDGEHKDDLFAVFDILNGATLLLYWRMGVAG